MKKPEGHPAPRADFPDRENQVFAPVVVGSGRTRVQLILHRQGRDLILRVTGGKAHVGAVAIWEGGSQAQLVELPHHKEGPLAEECAETVGRAAGCTTVAIVGIHQDDAMPEEIAAIVRNVRQGAIQLAGTLQGLERESDD